MRKSNYGLIETIENIVFMILTKIYIPNARLVRFPIIIRGKKYINFGRGLTTGRNCRIEVNGTHDCKVLCIGNNVNIGDNVSFRCAKNIEIGNNVLIGSRVLIIDHSHGAYDGNEQDNPDSTPNSRKLCAKRIVIGDNVWIGENVVIQKGVNIGKGSIVGANSVITKDVIENSIVGGIPGKVLKKYNKVINKWEKYEI